MTGIERAASNASGTVNAGSPVTLKEDSTFKHGLGGSVAAIRPCGGDRLGTDRHTPTATAADREGPAQGRRREAANQRERPSLRDVAQYPREVSGHAARFERARVLLRRGEQGVFFRSGSGYLPAHSQLLQNRQTALSEARVPDELRRGTGVLRYLAGCDRRLLLRGLSGSQARKC